ncbi:MAG: C45 family autoproteolytic acyltransferase/hydolase [Sandaracinaceae bacterium]
MRTIHLPERATAFERGLAHGEAFRDEIAAIAAIRSELCRTQGLFRTDAELLDVAALHLPALERFDHDLAAELRGIAEGARLDPARIVVLNHYTDLKDLDPAGVLDGAGPARARDVEREEDCSAIVAGTPEGPFLGQTWDMHGSAAPFVTMLHVPTHEATDGRAVPEAWLLSITGCLGMAGMNAAGVGITINNLKSNDARVGLVWPALVRRCLGERTAEGARDIVLGAPLGSGHHYLVADARRAYGIETSGTLAEVWAEADLTRPGTGFHHENHCLGTVVAKVSSISPVSTTLARHAFLEASLSAHSIESGEDLWMRLGSHEGFPRSVCTHLASETSPHAMLTCAGLLLDLGRRRVLAHPGCIHGVTPTHYPFASQAREPARP